MDSNRVVTLCEMAPRDGMQIVNRDCKIPLQERVQLVRLLQEAGLAYIEVGSFVRQDRVPSMQDTPELLQSISRYEGQLAVLVPNLRYYSKHADCQNLDTVALFLASSENYTWLNKGITIEKDLVDARELVSAARKDGRRVRAHLSCAFRDIPSHAPTPAELVCKMCRELLEAGCELVALADTDGRASGADIRRVLGVLAKDTGLQNIGLHLHDRFGLGIAHAMLAYEMGVRTFDTAAAGIGGNKIVRNSVGNVATEELAFHFEGMGISTGIEMERLMKAAHVVRQMTRQVGDPEPPSRILVDDLLSTQLIEEFLGKLPDCFDPQEYISPKLQQFSDEVFRAQEIECDRP